MFQTVILMHNEIREVKYLPLGFGEVLFYLRTNPILYVLVWGSISRNPERRARRFLFFFIILFESWHIYSLINNCLHLINSTSFLFIYSFIDFYHSWAMASCAVSRWSWSTSIKDVTNVLAAETRESIKPPAWCVRVSGTTWLTAVILPESEMSSQYGESNS